jgi:hypothetical protein
MTSPQANYNLAALAEAAFHRLGDHESLVFEGGRTGRASCSTGPAGRHRGW